MPFTSLKLHPSLLKGIKELGFARPTPVQADAIPPALEGRDVLASAMTGSGKTAAFLLPIVHRLIDRPRGTTRALVITPTRELALQIYEDLKDLAVHTPITGATVIGGLGMGPQEHAFRSGADIIIATPGRLLDHMRAPYAKLGGLEHLVLDEADRMLDMGFLPEISRILRHLPRQAPNTLLQRDHAGADPPVDERAAAQSGYRAARAQGGGRSWDHPGRLPRAAAAQVGSAGALLQRGEMREALVFTRTKHRANRLADYLLRTG